MLNEFNTLKNWVQSEPHITEQSSVIELTQTYQEWLRERFITFKSPATSDETRSM